MEAFIKELEKCNKEQKEFILIKPSNGVLVGIPGGGKSTCVSLFGMYNYINNIFKTNEILYLMFNKDAQVSLLNKLSEFIKKPTYVRTFDSLVDKGCKDNNIKFSDYSDELSEDEKSKIFDQKKWSFVEMIRNTLPEKIKIDYLSKIKLIIVDEAQDINNEEYQIINFLVKRLNCYVIYVGDGNQNIYSDLKDSSSRFMNNHGGFRINLKINYRSTKQIIEFSKKYMDEYRDIVSSNDTGGDKPYYVISSSRYETLKYKVRIIKMLIEQGYEYGDISIAVNTKKNGKFLQDYLEKCNIVTLNCYRDNSNSNSKKNAVKIYTYWKMKGLENKIVFLHNFSTWNTINENTRRWEPYEEELLTRIKYVGLTRAKEKLFICYDKTNENGFGIEKCEIIDYIPKELYVKVIL